MLVSSNPSSNLPIPDFFFYYKMLLTKQLLLTVKQEPYKTKAFFLMKNRIIWEENGRRMAHQQMTGQHRNSMRRRQKRKSGDRKVESNDSAEIPDRRGDIKHPQPAFRAMDFGENTDSSLPALIQKMKLGIRFHRQYERKA